MKKENMYVPSGLKTRDGKDIMCYTAEFYVKNKAQIDRIIKKCEEILMEYDESEESENAQDNSNSSKENKNILKEDAEEYDKEIHINKKHDKLFKEILSDKREAMLIEKSKNTEELYQNIEDVIKNQKEKNALNKIQLEKLVQYELAETKDEKMIKDFIEKIRNAKGEDEIMTNASRIINNEMRKQRKAGIKENQEKVIRRLKLMNLSTQQIAKAVELEIKEVEKILNEKQ